MLVILKLLLCINIIYTHFPEVKLCGDITSRSVIDFLKDLFSRYSLVNENVTDHGAQFVSHEFKSFLRKNGIRYSRTALYHPQSNSFERFNRVLKEGMKAQLC